MLPRWINNRLRDSQGTVNQRGQAILYRRNFPDFRGTARPRGKITQYSSILPQVTLPLGDFAAWREGLFRSLVKP